MIEEKQIVRFEPYYGEWISMDSHAKIYSIEFEDNFRREDYPNISFIKNNNQIEGACSAPIVLQILLTRKCTYACKNCQVYDNTIAKELTTDEVFTLLNQAAANGVLLVRLSGGEATLRPDFVNIVDYARNLGLRVSLISNCYSHTESVRSVFSSLCYVQTHLDTVNPKTFAQLTGGKDFIQYDNTLHKAIETGVSIHAATTLQRENLSELPDIVRYGSELGIPMKIHATYSNGTFSPKAWESYYKNVIVPFRQMWPKLIDIASKKGVEIHSFVERYDISESVIEPLTIISPWGHTFIVIDSQGIVYPNSFLLLPQFKLGSIRDGDDFMNIWRNSSLLKEIREITKKSLGCDSCRKDCVFVNPFFSYSYFGKFGEVLPHADCPYGKFRIKNEVC